MKQQLETAMFSGNNNCDTGWPYYPCMSFKGKFTLFTLLLADEKVGKFLPIESFVSYRDDGKDCTGRTLQKRLKDAKMSTKIASREGG